MHLKENQRLIPIAELRAARKGKKTWDQIAERLGVSVSSLRFAMALGRDHIVTRRVYRGRSAAKKRIVASIDRANELIGADPSLELQALLGRLVPLLRRRDVTRLEINVDDETAKLIVANTRTIKIGGGNGSK